MKACLDYRKDFLCVLGQYEVLRGQTQTLVKEWYPVRPTDEAEVTMLLGRPLTEVDSDEGIYVDDEGNVFQLAEKGTTKAIEVERSSIEREEMSNGQTVSPDEKEASEEIKASARGKSKRVRLKTRRSDRAIRVGPFRDPVVLRNGAERQEQQNSTAMEPVAFAQLNLRQKLAVVRRRLVYVQKRGYNPRFNYNYVTAADIAGAVGDILAELGVVVVPRLESISHEATRAQGRTEAEHVARVVMSYSFVDVDTAEEITVKTAGEGLDSGDKAPYKAMTGALKYALLQSFLLATGDDPEEERFIPTNRSSSPTRGERSERTITADELRELRQLIDDTGTELERVLTYYKLTSLDEMTEATYRRALDLLQRKRAKQVLEDATHAQN
jgi:ERF superfamily